MLIFDIAMFQTNFATTYSKYFIRSGHHATSEKCYSENFLSGGRCRPIVAPESDV